MTPTPALSVFIIALISVGAFPIFTPEQTSNAFWDDWSWDKFTDEFLKELTDWIEGKIIDAIRSVELFVTGILYSIQDLEEQLLSFYFDDTLLEAQAHGNIWVLTIYLFYCVFCIIGIFLLIRIYTFVLDVVPVI